MGKRTKIAPTLQMTAVAACVDCGPQPCRTCVKARAELRALIAVARAAEEWAGTPYPIDLRPCDSRLVRALNRLRNDGSDRWPARASGEGGKP